MPVIGALLSPVFAMFMVAAPPAERFWVEAPLLLAASGPASGVETILVPWALLRAGKLWDVSELAFTGLLAGADVAVWAGGFESEGTPEVSANRAYAALEARGLVSRSVFATTLSGLSPYAFVGVRAGGGIGEVAVFDDSRTMFLPYWGARGGLGLELIVLSGVLKSEVAGGARDGRLELTGALSLGGVF